MRSDPDDFKGGNSMTLKARVKNGFLRIELPLEQPRESASGKTRVVATTHGLVDTGIEYHGSAIVVNANAFIRNRNEPDANE
jgi:hypothetical protein